MNHLWSPWRMKYIQKTATDEGCVFCNLPAQRDGLENLIVLRKQRAYVILNRYPYTSGHMMIVPFAHQPSLEQLDPETRAEMIELVTQTVEVLREVYQPQGFNVGMNIGEAAGAGIAEHTHIHVVPRWIGDTNFMSVTGQTRVLPETLEETWQRVRAAWSKRGE